MARNTSEFTTVSPQDIPIPQMHQYLLGAIAPRPIAFASTIDPEGNINLSPFSFFNVFSSNPPTLIFSPARGRDKLIKHTLDNVQKVPQVVINTVNYPMVQQMSLTSTAYPKQINEFEKAGFTEIKSTLVKPPRVKESPVAFECKINQIIPLGENAGAGNLVIAEVLLIHLQNQYLVDGQLDLTKLDLVGRMGANWYCHTNSLCMFEVQKPGKKQGIGVDQLPQHIRNSSILTGNDLGKLGSLATLPSTKELNKVRNTAEFEAILLLPEDQRMTVLHQTAQHYIMQEQTADALAMLLAF